MNGGALNIICDGSAGESGGIDSDKVIYINGGKVIASGNMFDHIAGGDQTYAVFRFADRQEGNNTYTLKNSDGKVVYEYAPVNAFTYFVVAGEELIPGNYTLWQGDAQLTAIAVENTHGGMPREERSEMPKGMENMIPPDNMKPMEFDGETSATFTIKKVAIDL